MTSSVKAVINPELRNILLNEGLMQGFRLLLGVEDTVYVTLLFSLFSYSQMWWNSIVTYTASSTPNKNQDFNNIRRHWIYDGETTHFFSTLDRGWKTFQRRPRETVSQIPEVRKCLTGTLNRLSLLPLILSCEASLWSCRITLKFW